MCIPFEVTAGAPLRKFQLALDSGFSDHAGEWLITETSEPPEAPAEETPDEGDGELPPPRSLTADVHCRAGDGAYVRFPLWAAEVY